jgi:undecaprenyl-diphosphatase
MNIDSRIFLAINGWAGHSSLFDAIFKGLANDYFLLISVCLLLVFWWFGTRDKVLRESMQRSILIALIGIGFANGLVEIINQFIFRIRPFNVFPEGSVNLLFYRPTDSSFPSNFASVLFAIAVAVFINNKKKGAILLAIAALGGLSRVYVGVHYPLDIIGGAALGTVATLLAYGVGKLLEPVIAYVLKLLRLLRVA